MFVGEKSNSSSICFFFVLVPVIKKLNLSLGKIDTNLLKLFIPHSRALPADFGCNIIFFYRRYILQDFLLADLKLYNSLISLKVKFESNPKNSINF